MDHYISVREVDIEQPAVLSFDVSNSKLKMEFGVKFSNTLEVDTNNNTENVTEIIENSLNHNTSHEDNTFCGEKVLIECNESASGLIDENNELINRPNLIGIQNNFITFSNYLSNLTNGSVIFFLTQSPSTDNIIHSELGIYEEKYKDSINITPFILGIDEEEDTTNDDYALLLDVDDTSLSFLLLGHECSKNFSISPTTIYKKKAKQNSVKYVYSTEYQETPQITDNYRGRFVMSNNGRIVTFSIYNTETKIWDIVRELVFDSEKIHGKHHIIFSVSDSSAITDITSNF